MSYQHTPGYQKHSDTSKAAAGLAAKSQASREDEILSLLRQGDINGTGYTADEIHEILSEDDPLLQAGTIAARLRGLELKNKAVKAAATRMTRSGSPAHPWFTKEMAVRMAIPLAAKAPPKNSNSTTANNDNEAIKALQNLVDSIKASGVDVWTVAAVNEAEKVLAKHEGVK